MRPDLEERDPVDLELLIDGHKQQLAKNVNYLGDVAFEISAVKNQLQLRKEHLQALRAAKVVLIEEWEGAVGMYKQIQDNLAKLSSFLTNTNTEIVDIKKEIREIEAALQLKNRQLESRRKVPRIDDYRRNQEED